MDPVTEIRRVEVHDPRLSDEANRLLTKQVRLAVGRDRVTVADGAPDHSHGPIPGTRPSLRTLTVNRPLVAVTLVSAVVVGGIVALASHEWWVFAIAIGLHVLGTILVTGGVLLLAARTEHMDPDVSAWLQAEGVADPDRALAALVADYSTGDSGVRAPRTAEILLPQSTGPA